MFLLPRGKDRGRKGHSAFRFRYILGCTCDVQRSEVIPAESRAGRLACRHLDHLDQRPILVTRNPPRAPLRVPEPPLGIHHRAVRLQVIRAQVEINLRRVFWPSAVIQRSPHDLARAGVREVGPKPIGREGNAVGNGDIRIKLAQLPPIVAIDCTKFWLQCLVL